MPSDRPLPEGTVTFLLTDVEGSTRRWEAEPDAMAEAIARHYLLLDEAIDAHGGVRPQEQGEGDSVVAVFTDAAHAVAAAVAAQRAMMTEPWPTSSPLAVRMALHAGQAAKRNDENYMGPTVIRCARLRACGHGGQIIVSDTVAQLVRGRLDAGVSLASLGINQLKDLQAPEHVHQVLADGLPASFPALLSLAADRHNLPLQIAPLLGRDREIAELCALARGSRLVTLTGSGGVGKTRLAFAAGAELVDDFDGGVWWVDLATTSDPAAVAALTLAAVGASAQHSVTPLDQLVAVLRPERSIAIVLDNCEHVIDACADVVARVLSSCGGVTVIATSREPLGVVGEVTWRVASLALPSSDDVHATDIEDYSALALFWDRARRARPQIILTDALAKASAQICRRVDGIPLAIELAAARCRQLSPERIANELEEHYRLLVGGGRTQMARQRTLEASVDWSHALLSPDEQVVFRRLGVFIGWFPVSVVESVIATFDDIDTWAALDIVTRLVDRSLLIADNDSDEPVYRMLETVRFYALERARETKELEALRDAHALAWTEWSERTHDQHRGLTSMGERRFVARFVPNLTDALRWVEADSDRAARLLTSSPWAQNLFESVASGMHVRIAQRLHDEDHARWREVACFLSLLAVGGGNIDFVLGPALQAASWARERGEDYLLCHALTGLGFLDPTGASWRDLLEAGQRIGNAGFELVGRLALATVGLDPLPKLRAELMAVEALGRRVRYPDTNYLQAGADRALSSGDFEDAQRLLIDVRSDLESDPNPLVPLRFWALGQEAILASMTGDVAAMTTVASRRQSRALRDLPVYWSAGWNGAVELGAHHLLGTPLDTSALEQALQFGGTHDTQELYRLPAFALVDRGHTAPVRASLAAARAVPCSSDSYRCLFLDWIDAAAGAADGDTEADASLRDVLGRAHAQGALPIVIDTLELLAVSAAERASGRASKLLAAADKARAEIGYTLRFPNLAAALGAITVSGDPPLALDAAVAYAQRPYGKRDRPATGWDSLTPAEREVTNLLAAGATNKQIAQQLSMSANTVKTHIAHIYAKCEVKTRAQLASIVARR